MTHLSCEFWAQQQEILVFKFFPLRVCVFKNLSSLFKFIEVI